METGNHKYQLVQLGEIDEIFNGDFISALTKQFSVLGLSFDNHGAVLKGAGVYPEWEGFPVAVWLGGTTSPNSSEVKLVDEFLRRGFVVFPVLDSDLDFTESFPENLHPINGHEKDVITLASSVMSGFRLTRKTRQAFISYRRSESTGVANQLFHELTDRGYRVFLDTASIESGADFQNALWSRMADVDLLVLLDTPTALESTWVHQELNRAHDLGMAVIQLTWPEHNPPKGTELSRPVRLQAKDFEGEFSDSVCTLEKAALAEAVDTIESERIRSLNSRRTRVIDEITRSFHGDHYRFVVHPAHHLDVLKQGVKIAEVLPFVGVPDSPAVHDCEKNSNFAETVVVYNGLGVDPEWAEHINWLRDKAKVEVFQSEEFSLYLEKFLK